MKNAWEILAAMFVGMFSWALWTQILTTILLAFITGALGYLGRYLMQRLIAKFSKEKLPTE